MHRKSIVLFFTLPMLASSVFQADLAFSQQSSQNSSPSFRARDPGVRNGTSSVGGAIRSLSGGESALYDAGLQAFAEVDGLEEGLGPRMNLDSCAGCHAYPAVGGSSPPVNPQAAFVDGGGDTLPSFIAADGPVREVRFVKNSDGTPDGGVHNLFTITGRPGADGCTLKQPDFAGQLANNNVTFRIPTPLFGDGLIEQIPDSQILANQASSTSLKRSLGIRGRANFQVAGRAISGQGNNNGNDGTIARFGWKAQNKSLLLFSGEAYNVEQGVTNELFQNERDETPACQYAMTPNDSSHPDAATMVEALSDIEKFAFFGRFLAPPVPSANTPGGASSISSGKKLFTSVGCALCHTPTLNTGNATVVALRNKPVNLYSDLLVHDMGPGLADGISQGQAGPSEFRSAPLWGLGQRVFFLHDGRASDLVQAIQAHRSGSASSNNASEANGVIVNYNNLSEGQKQDLLDFLRSL